MSQTVSEEQRRILLERPKDLNREPVSGPEGVAVARWYAGTGEFRYPWLSRTRYGLGRRQGGSPPFSTSTSAR
jgi:hypothetical protein